MPLSNAQIRTIIIKRKIRATIASRAVAKKASNDGTSRHVASNDNAPRAMSKGLLASCVAAGGFDQNARYI